MWRTTVLSRAPFQVPGRALVQALGRALVQVPGRALFKVPGRVLVQALGRAPHPHHSALLLSRFKKSCATASVEAPVGISYLRYMIHLFICLKMSSIAPVLASISSRVLARVLFITKNMRILSTASFILFEGECSSASLPHERVGSQDDETCWSCCGIVPDGHALEVRPPNDKGSLPF